MVSRLAQEGGAGACEASTGKWISEASLLWDFLNILCFGETGNKEELEAGGGEP